MERVNAARGAFEIWRRRASERRAEPAATGAVSDAPRAATADQPADAAAAVRQAALARRIRAIDGDDPMRDRKAFRIFLESILLAEFGGQLLSDPAFHDCVDAVHRQMEADDELVNVMQAAARLLIERHGAAPDNGR